MKLMSPPKFLQSLKVTHIVDFYHISCGTSDRIWVSSEHELILVNTKGKILHHREDMFLEMVGNGSGKHTVNSDNELFYIHSNNNIHKLSKDMKNTRFIKKCSFWTHRCIYWSTITNDLLVGMCGEKTWTCKVNRYNRTGQLTQSIQHDNTGLDLYCMPNYITENNNRDVVVSDSNLAGAVVVTDYKGRHRFTYAKHPRKFFPVGICTDAMSHILVCEGVTRSINTLNKDGQFLSHLGIKLSIFDNPSSLSYDFNRNCIWVGFRNSHSCTVFAYRYIHQQTGKSEFKLYNKHANYACMTKLYCMYNKN